MTTLAPPEYDFKGLVAQALRTATQRDPASKDHFRMSSLGHCYRAQVGLRAELTPTNPFDDRTMFKLWTGTEIGRQLRGLLEAHGVLDPTWSEKEVRYRNYVGHVDGALLNHPDGACLWECKTSDDDAITKPDWPQHYAWQTAGYMLASGIPRCLLFQLGKNQGLSRTMLFALDERWTKAVNANMDGAEWAWEDYQKTKILPDHFHQFGWEDRYCPFLETP